MNEMEQLKSRIAALEATLAADGKDEEKVDEKKASSRSALASEIAALEKVLAADDEEETACTAADDEEETACTAADDEKSDEKKASEVDPSGIEEEITQDKFSEVERIEHGEELASAPSMGAVAPTESEYVARMAKVSARLDRVANYLEKHGQRRMAYRIDRVADAVDAKINSMRRK